MGAEHVCTNMQSANIGETLSVRSGLPPKQRFLSSVLLVCQAHDERSRHNKVRANLRRTGAFRLHEGNPDALAAVVVSPLVIHKQRFLLRGGASGRLRLHDRRSRAQQRICRVAGIHPALVPAVSRDARFCGRETTVRMGEALSYLL